MYDYRGGVTMALPNEFRLQKFTRREFRLAREAGRFDVAVVATGSIEQHLEHLAFEQDIASSTRIAEMAAERLYPQVVLAVPINVGIAEHHMHSVGTLTVKPSTWLAVVFDTVETLVRHGIRKVLILNGHGGNRRPIYGIMSQWQMYFDREHGDVDLRFHNYWDVLTHEIVKLHPVESRLPKPRPRVRDLHGHAPLPRERARRGHPPLRGRRRFLSHRRQGAAAHREDGRGSRRAS